MSGLSNQAPNKSLPFCLMQVASVMLGSCVLALAPAATVLVSMCIAVVICKHTDLLATKESLAGWLSYVPL